MDDISNTVILSIDYISAIIARQPKLWFQTNLGVTVPAHLNIYLLTWNLRLLISFL